MKTFFAAMLALSMLAAPAMAASYDARPGQPNQTYGKNQGHSSQPDRGQFNRQKPQPKPQYSYEGKKYDAVRGPQWDAPKGHDAHRNWNRGQKLPSAYRNRSRVIDYRAYHLKQPPRGHQWVRVNDNAYLVQQSNGLISQIVLSMFY